MLEPWRSSYLRALGVDVYLPSHPLPGAAPSMDVGWADGFPLVEAEAPIALEEFLPGPVGSASQSATAAASIDAGTATLPAASQPAPATTVPLLRIKLMIAASDCGVLIVDDALGDARHEGQRLLANLLFALHGQSAGIKAEPFDWPLPTLRNRAIALDESAARETLAAFLNRKIADGNIHTMWLLGANAQRWVDASLRPALATSRALHWGVSIGTAAVLGDARLKRQWWRELRGPLASN